MALELLMAEIKRIFEKPPTVYYNEAGLHRQILDAVRESNEPLSPKSVAEKIRDAVANGDHEQPQNRVTVKRVKTDSRFLIGCGLVERTEDGQLFMNPGMRKCVEDYFRIRDLIY